MKLRPGSHPAPPTVLALFVSFMMAGCNPLFYHPSRGSHDDAAGAGFAFKDHVFASSSGNRLHGRFFPAAEGTPRKGLWIFFHGNSRNLSGTYSAYAWVTREGWDYFVFDYSGYGESEGSATREALFQDGLACLRYAASEFPIRAGGKLVLSGGSLGGTVLLASAAAWEGRRTASLLFVDCAFPTYRDVAQAVLADRWYAWPFQLLGRALVTDEHAPASTLDSLRDLPLLITHCRDDGEVPFRMGERLHALASASRDRVPARFWPLADCGHTRGFAREFPRNRTRLMRFVDSLPAAIEGPPPAKAFQGRE